MKNKEIIFLIASIVIVILGLFMPKSGDLVLFDELFTVLVIWIVCIYVIYKVYMLQKSEKKSQTIIRIILVLCCVLVGVFFSYGLVIDVFSGTEEVCLSDIKLSKSQGMYGIISLRYYVSGTDSNGETFRFEISGNDYEMYLNREIIFVEYYEYTDRVKSLR